MSEVPFKAECNLYEQSIHGDEVEIRMRFRIASLATPPTAFKDMGELASMSLIVFSCSNAAALIETIGTMPPHIAGACNAIASMALDAREQLIIEAEKKGVAR